MTIIAVANTKGGQGKTTWACTLAAYLGAELWDLNPENGDAFAWSVLADRPCRSLYSDDLQALCNAAKSKAMVVVDCPPWEGQETRAALASAKMVLVPVAAGFQDLRGLGRMMRLAKEAQQMANPGLKIAILGNGRRAVGFTTTWEEALQGYHKPKDGTLYLGSVPQRQAIVDAFGAGLPAHQAAEPAAHEVLAILSKIVKLLQTN